MRTYEWKFKSHLEFIQSWIRDTCPKSTILVKNRGELLLQPQHLNQEIDQIWDNVMRNQLLCVGDDDPKHIVESIIARSTHMLQLRDEIVRDKKQLRKTQIGQLYIKQLKR
jgi:hypothetical protein